MTLLKTKKKIENRIEANIKKEIEQKRKKEPKSHMNHIRS